ncbi:MAG: hypothetical protein AAF743_04895 [Planctomycetota bacterium]
MHRRGERVGGGAGDVGEVGRVDPDRDGVFDVAGDFDLADDEGGRAE